MLLQYNSVVYCCGLSRCCVYHAVGEFYLIISRTHCRRTQAAILGPYRGLDTKDFTLRITEHIVDVFYCSYQ